MSDFIEQLTIVLDQSGPEQAGQWLINQYFSIDTIFHNQLSKFKYAVRKLHQSISDDDVMAYHSIFKFYQFDLMFGTNSETAARNLIRLQDYIQVITDLHKFDYRFVIIIEHYFENCFNQIINKIETYSLFVSPYTITQLRHLVELMHQYQFSESLIFKIKDRQLFYSLQSEINVK